MGGVVEVCDGEISLDWVLILIVVELGQCLCIVQAGVLESVILECFQAANTLNSTLCSVALLHSF